MMNLAGKKGLILGAANEHSIAWGCALMAKQMGADVMVTCLNEKARPYVEPLTSAHGIHLEACNVEETGALERLVDIAFKKLGQFDFVIHSIAWALLRICTAESSTARASDSPEPWRCLATLLRPWPNCAHPICKRVAPCSP